MPYLSTSQSERAEKKRRRAVAAMLGELTFADDADANADADAAPVAPKPKPTHSRPPSSSSAPALPTLVEAAEDRPSPFLARVAPAAPVPASGRALAQILAMADDSPVRTAPSLPRKVDPVARDRALAPGENRPARALHSIKTTERKKVVVTATFGAGGKRKTGKKENSGERRQV